jgi:hypothetical protein
MTTRQLEVKEKGQEAKIVKLPVEIWQKGSTWSFAFPSTAELESIKLNPRGILPDVDTKNDTWKP